MPFSVDSSVGEESACNAGDPGSIPGSGRSPGEGIGYPLQYSWVSLVAQLVKNLPAMWENWVQSLGWEDLLEEGMATHFTILAWRIPMDRIAWWATVHVVTKSLTRLSDFHFFTFSSMLVSTGFHSSPCLFSQENCLHSWMYKSHLMCWWLPDLIFQPKSLFLALNICSQPLNGHFKVYVSEAPKLSNVPGINHQSLSV